MKNQISGLPLQVADMSGDAILAVTKEGQMLFVNKKSACILPGAAVAQRLPDILAAKAWYMLQQNLMLAFYQHRLYQFDWIYNERFYQVSALPVERVIWLNLADVTEERRQTHTLYLHQQQIDFVEQVAHLGYWQFDKTRNQFFWSRGMFRLFEQSENEMPPAYRFVKRFIYAEDWPLYLRKLKQLWYQKQPVQGVLRVITSRQKLKKCWFYAAFGTDETGDQVVGVMQELIPAEIGCPPNESVFFKGLLHDVRQPLHLIQLLADEALEQDEQSCGKTLRNIVQCNQKAIDICMQALEKNKVVSKVMTPFSINLGEVVANVGAEYQVMARSYGIQLVVCSTFYPLKSQPLLLERVLHNLLSNALKAAASKVKLKMQKNCIYIANDLPVKYTKKHTDEYTNESVTLINKSVGMGVNIVRNLVQDLGGKMEVRMRPYGYALVKVCLPI
jgi:signal transduction histidine kinase